MGSVDDLFNFWWRWSDHVTIRSQQRQIDTLRDRLAYKGSSLQNSRERIQELEHRVDELALVNRALIMVLKESGTLDGDKLLEAMKKLDAEKEVDDRLRPSKTRKQRPNGEEP